MDEYYAYDLSIQSEIDTRYMFTSSLKDKYVYEFDIKHNEDPNLHSKSEPIPILSKESYFTLSSEYNMNHYEYFSNVYNAELCDDEWMRSIYFLNSFYTHFIHNGILDIRSVHIDNSKGSTIAAFNHFIFNSNVLDRYGINWKWLTTSKNVLSDEYSIHNLKIIPSETDLVILSDKISHRLSSFNLILIDNFKNCIIYAALIANLMDENGMCYVRVPDVKNWNTHTINTILLYSLMFEEVRLYKFESCKIYILCKNLKRNMEKGRVYKKLVRILSKRFNPMEYNLFHEELFQIPELHKWLDNILHIISKYVDQCDVITCDVMCDSIFKKNIDILKINTNTLLI